MDRDPFRDFISSLDLIIVTPPDRNYLAEALEHYENCVPKSGEPDVISPVLLWFIAGVWFGGRYG